MGIWEPSTGRQYPVPCVGALRRLGQVLNVDRESRPFPIDEDFPRHYVTVSMSWWSGIAVFRSLGKSRWASCSMFRNAQQERRRLCTSEDRPSPRAASARSVRVLGGVVKRIRLLTRPSRNEVWPILPTTTTIDSFFTHVTTMCLSHAECNWLAQLAMFNSNRF